MKPIYRKYFKIVALVWGGCFVLFFFIYIVALVPQRKNKRITTDRLAEKKMMYKTARKAAQEETKDKLNEQIERLQYRLRDFVIGFNDSANLTFDISEIAKKRRVASFSIESVKDKNRHTGSGAPDYKYLNENCINVNFIGAFNQFATFLNALERHRPVVFVDKFSIARSEKNAPAHEVKMELVFFATKRQEKDAISAM